jgi:two-component system OmpR family sensor kinase
MVLTTTTTVLIFACVVYALVRAEATEGAGQLREDAGEEVLFAMLFAGPVCLVLSVAGALILSRRALAPIGAVIGEASAMTAEDLHRRLSVPKENDELRDLVLTLNALLARLDEGFAALASYASSASHELRTPLAVITSELEIALRRPRAAEEWEQTARTSLDEIQRLANLIEALLELARAGASSNLQSFELRERLDQVLASLEASVASDGVSLVRPEDGAEVWLHGEADLLMNAASELVRNAARYSPSGKAVRIRVERRDGRAAIHVDDEGPGVDPAERETIFVPFARGGRGVAVDATGKGPRGLGLGLAIAKRSVESCGGTISVGVSPEGGARFTIELPADDAPR